MLHSTVLIRPFALSDLKALAASLNAIWFSHDRRHTRSEKLFGLHYLTACLGRADLCLCLETDDQICGAVICALPASASGYTIGRLGRLQKFLLQALCACCALAIRLNPCCADGKAHHQRYGENYRLLAERVRDRRNKGEIILLFTSPAVQGRGLGKWLLQAGEQALQAGGARQIFLLTDVNCNFKLYPRCGYTLTDRISLDFSASRGAGEDVFDCFIYEKTL